MKRTNSYLVKYTVPDISGRDTFLTAFKDCPQGEFDRNSFLGALIIKLIEHHKVSYGIDVKGHQIDIKLFSLIDTYIP